MKNRHNQKNKSRHKSKFNIKMWCIPIGVIIFLIGGFMLSKSLYDYWKAAHLYKDTATHFVTLRNENDQDKKKAIVDKIVIKEKSWEDFIDVDIVSLREQNEDIVGWIFFENEDISYPVLNSGDNSKYLRRAYTGEKLQAGSIFMDGDNSRDFSDAHTLIYGHNMKDLSMFGRLRYYDEDSEYIKGHEYFQIITEDKKYRYKIFSYKEVPGNSPIYAIHKNGDADFESFIEKNLKTGSFLDKEAIIGTDDYIVTLSTCANDDRFVVSAVRCDETSLK